MANIPTVVFFVLYRRDFYATPKIECASLDEQTALTKAHELAKRKFRYTGPLREQYTYFDQDIRIDSYPLS